MRHEKRTDKLSVRQQSIYCAKNARNALLTANPNIISSGERSRASGPLVLITLVSGGLFSWLKGQGSHRLEKYLSIQDCLEKPLKIKFALESS